MIDSPSNLVRRRRGLPWPGGVSAAASIALLIALPAMLPTTTAIAQQTPQIQDLATFPRTTLEVVHRDHAHGVQRHSFDVWIADTPARAEQGLMFVHDLPPTRGMVFPLMPPRVETMWMKNTYIELDMLFVGTDGKVSRILERARPLSLDLLSSEDPVAAVVELRGGTISRLQLRVGDSVSWKPPPPETHSAG